MINYFLEKYFFTAIFFILLILWCFSVDVLAQTEGTIQQGLNIEAYGLSDQPFIPLQNNNRIIPISLCYLDLYDKAKTTLNQTIRTDIFQNNQQITSKYKDFSLGAVHQYQADIQKIGSYYRCCYNAQFIGITKIPAVVFIQKQKSYVIYGENDLNKAILEYQQFISQARNRE